MVRVYARPDPGWRTPAGTAARADEGVRPRGSAGAGTLTEAPAPSSAAGAPRAAGLSTREIAERLFVSENTVKTHCGRLFDKLGARNLGGIRDSADRIRVDLDPGRA